MRVATAADADLAGAMVARSREEIYRVRRELLGEYLADLAFPEVFERKRASSAELVRKKPEQAFIAEVEGEMAGLVCWDIRPDGAVGELVEVTVDPKYQRRGIGSGMCRHVLALLRRRGCRAVLVKTGLDEGHAGARALYERLGFAPALPWIHYYQALETLEGAEGNGD
jgi:ribosomal protein S18 acetylase RimI-like enzyme